MYDVIMLHSFRRLVSFSNNSSEGVVEHFEPILAYEMCEVLLHRTRDEDSS